MNDLRKVGRGIYKAYVGVGMAAMGVVAFGVIFSVVMRYCFSITFTFLEELITLLFAFTTFWGAGICILEEENVLLDFFYMNIPAKPKRILDIINMVFAIIVMSVVLYYSFGWIDKAGKALSNGLRLPYRYIYSAMPIGLVASIISAVVKLWSLVTNTPLNLKPVEEEEEEEEAIF